MRDSADLLRVVHEGMVQMGLDTNAVYQRLGYDSELLNLDAPRTPHQMQAHFWGILEVVSRDPDIGLHLCPHLPMYRGEILEYLMFSAATFGEGARRTAKYLRLVSDAMQMKLVTDEQGARVVLKATAADAPQLRHTEICVMYGLLQFCREVTGGAFKPLKVSLRWARRAEAHEYDAIFGCMVAFEAPENAIWFDPAVLTLPSPRSNPELLQVHEEVARKRISKLERQDLIERIRAIFAQRLELQNCDLDVVARELGLPARRLRFELAQAGTSFSEVLSEFRYALAKRLLARTAEPIDNIVYLTGFSEPSTFYRAFKRWSGMTPVQYREQKRRTPKAA